MRLKVVITYDEEYRGYVVDVPSLVQTGSHMILAHASRPTLSVPNHAELAPGLVRGLIRKSGLTVEEFLEPF